MFSSFLNEPSLAGHGMSDQFSLILALGIWVPFSLPVLEAYIDTHSIVLEQALLAVLERARWSKCERCAESVSQDGSKLTRLNPVIRHRQLSFDSVRAAVY